jgi:2'-5' RNA ligase
VKLVTEESIHDSPQHKRLFVAVTVPEEVRGELETAQRQLQHCISKGKIRWTPREQFHATLKFLGNVDANRVEALAAALREACRSFAALQLRAARVGFFPNARAPRVVWIGIEESQGQLIPLQEAVETATRGFSGEPPDERFTGHVTLARIKLITPPEAGALAKLTDGMAAREFGRWIANGIELMSSELATQGAKHKVEARIALGHRP